MNKDNNWTLIILGILVVILILKSGGFIGTPIGIIKTDLGDSFSIVSPSEQEKIKEIKSTDKSSIFNLFSTVDTLSESTTVSLITDWGIDNLGGNDYTAWIKWNNNLQRGRDYGIKAYIRNEAGGMAGLPIKIQGLYNNVDNVVTTWAFHFSTPGTYDMLFVIWDETEEPLETPLATTMWLNDALIIAIEKKYASLSMAILGKDLNGNYISNNFDFNTSNFGVVGFLKYNNVGIDNQKIDLYVNSNKVDNTKLLNYKDITYGGGNLYFNFISVIQPPLKIGINVITLKFEGSDEYYIAQISKGINIIGPGRYDCSIDSDCVKEQCCHATSGVNNYYAPNCQGMMCTMECKPETLDCGQGSIKCISGQCQAVIFECTFGQTQTETCSDGSSIIKKECVYNKWTDTGNTCPIPLNKVCKCINKQCEAVYE